MMTKSTNIDYQKFIKERVNTMKKMEGFSVDNFKLNKGISPDKVEKISSLLGSKIPSAILNFYSAVNGFELSWNYEDENTELFGCWDFWSLERLYFGYDGKISKTNLANPFEETLWSEEYEEKAIKELKQHKVIESVIGEDTYVTCKIIGENVQLFYTNEDRWKPIPIDFDKYVQVIVEFLGVSDIRAELAKPKFYNNPKSYRDIKTLNKMIPLNFDIVPSNQQ